MQGIHLYESKHREGNIVKEHHHQTYQILYALDGIGEITLDGHSLEFKQDHGVVIAPYSNHSIVSDSKLTVLVLAFDETILDSSVREELLRSHFSQSKLIRLGLFPGSELRQLLRKMLFEQSQETVLSILALNVFLSELLLVLVRSQQSNMMSDVNILRAEKLRSYIDTHYFEIVSSNDISAKLGVSARHINNIFKDHYNMTPLQYLTEVRMGLAQKMLSESETDIASICFEIGFETLSTFYRTFKNSIQMSPNKYRQLHKTRNGCESDRL
jgi:AraC-like DNA-binding protein